MKITRLLVPALILALAVPVSGAIAQNDGSTQATIAAKKKKKKKKKKLTWCQKKVKTELKKDKRYKPTLKRIGYVKAAKFSLYTRRYGKRTPHEYFACSEAPRFATTVTAWSGIHRTSHIRAVKNNCAVFFNTTKKGKSWDDGASQLKLISYHYFRKGSKYPPQTGATTLGKKGESFRLSNVVLDKNCVFAASYTVNGEQKIQFSALGDFVYKGFVERSMAGATAAEMKSIKVTPVSKTSSLISYTVNGVPVKVRYPEDVQR